MSISYKTSSSFSGFSCLGSDCEDTCCQSWDVKLDREHFNLLEIAMSKNTNEKSNFNQYVHINESSITSDHDYAFIRMGVNNYCSMLDDKGLCSIQVKHGVTVLGNVCTMFPRVISRCGDTVELSGALSCPEVVRKCIEDVSPLKLKRFKISDLPLSKNYPVQRELSNIEGDFYSENFEIVRGTMMKVMANEELELETRLYVVANLTHKISDFYHRGYEHQIEGKLKSALVILTEDGLIENLKGIIKDYDANSPLNMVVVHSILSIKLNQAEGENISLLYKKIIQKYNFDEEHIAEEFTNHISMIRSELNSDIKDIIDAAITRYIINCLYREWFVSMPDSFEYFQMLLVRISMLRALIYLDIGIENIDRHQLKERMVYIMYNFARNIDQNLKFLKVVYNALTEQSMINFHFSPAFIRIY